MTMGGEGDGWRGFGKKNWEKLSSLMCRVLGKVSCADRHNPIHDTYMATYIHTYIHTYIYTCIHTYIHICKNSYNLTFIYIHGTHKYIHIAT